MQEEMSYAEYIDITELLAQNKGFYLGNGVREKLLDMFRQVVNQKDFGNGRYARNILEKAKIKQASRNYAKRQQTWWRHCKEAKFVDICDKNFENIVNFAISLAESD